VETIEALREMTAVAGVHVMAFGQEHVVPELLERAGVPPRTATAPSATAGSNREDHDAR
jgi:methylenetetrahydrofolate reductase (NADPH)